MNKLWLLLPLMLVGACQCFVPVEQVRVFPRQPDAGHKVDAGISIIAECDAPTDCPGEAKVGPWCAAFSVDGGSGFSCVEHQCVAECGTLAGRTCVVGEGECLKCPATSGCIPVECSTTGTSMGWHIESVVCDGDSPVPAGPVTQRPDFDDAGASCSSTFAVMTDGGQVVLGTLYLQSARAISMRSALLGGTCLVHEVPTGAERLMLDCPLCQVTLGP